MKNKTADFVEPLVALAVICLLSLTIFSIVRPFLAATLWAGILVISTWRPYLFLVKCLRGRRALAAVTMIAALCCFILLPIVLAASDFSSAASTWSIQLHAAFGEGWPALPQWLVSLPVAGNYIDQFWNKLGAKDAETITSFRSYIAPASQLLLLLAKEIGSGMMLLVMSLFISFFIYMGGEDLLAWIRGFVERLAGERSIELLGISLASTKGVVYGFMGTAVVQAVLAWLAFLISGVPNAASLGFASFILALMPFGPSLIGLPAAAWLYYQGEVGWSIFMVVWMLFVVGSADNVIKPLLIGKGSSLPFILIFFGVLGGALAFGMLGVFIGPVLLTIFYELARSWIFYPQRLPPATVTTLPDEPKE
ncbi:AI-2E family transporter [Deefgea piscis]|uniref:AI-2E family transporter n=1 Tax=Deefgea piscis TaxID=2739061 RepID=A0A6M8SUC6_9NEIS|nr:AI-2E family transporter [Deefgea piscis]QKJ67116.1 AI-2E family transporter [Deefgea piscis]